MIKLDHTSSFGLCRVLNRTTEIQKASYSYNLFLCNKPYKYRVLMVDVFKVGTISFVDTIG